MSNICSICLVESSIVKEDETLSYKGKDLIVRGLSFYECPECGEQFADAALDKENSILIREAKKESDGLLLSKGIQKVREHLGITQSEAAKIFGGGANAFSKYERGEVSQSEAMDKLMRAAMSVDGLFKWLCVDAGIHPSRDQKQSEDPVHASSEDSQEGFEVVVFDTYVKTISITKNPLRFGGLEASSHGSRRFKSIDFCSDIYEETLEVRH